ncbi:DUF4115 domain-containing protein [Agarivorans sp. 1_MG-2023]|uniref:DUF4115 domain-containing protein n=1 Tax=Agarivorans sp. 1_MG-2023 TaxID=3062634 RepID=UPI0026E3562D|nr:DUF4115 domain-containing protein [Agarivorans sp. 1_MG-2023]MDO6763820.1 DUF4115 domain-containing protein [Agarivorans sp. 1_MG-2023]
MQSRLTVLTLFSLMCLAGNTQLAAEDEFDMDMEMEMDFPEPDFPEPEPLPAPEPDLPVAEVLPEIDDPEVELPIAPPPEEVIPPEEILPPIIVLPPPIYWLDDPWDYWYPHDYPRHYYRPASISVRVDGEVKIRIVDSEKHTLVDATLKEGVYQQWQGQAPFAVTVSDPTQIRMTYQGKDVDLNAYQAAKSAYFQVPPNSR